MVAKKSILDPLTCGFAKVAAYTVFTEPYEKVENKKKFEILLDVFKSYFDNNQKFEVDVRVFTRFYAIVKNIRSLGKTYPKQRKDVLDFFSKKSWVSLSKEEKEKQIYDCEGCKISRKRGPQ